MLSKLITTTHSCNVVRRGKSKEPNLPLFGHKYVSNLTCEILGENAKYRHMFRSFAPLFSTFSPSVPWRVWIGARLGGILFGILIILAIVLTKSNFVLTEPPTVQAIRLTSEHVKPRPPVVVMPPSKSRSDHISKPPPTPKLSPPAQAQSDVRPALVTSPNVLAPRAPQPASSLATNDLPQSPRIAQNPSALSPVPNNTGNSGDAIPRSGARDEQGTQGQLRGSTLALLRARECARLEERDRPINCPSNDELMRLLANERGPKYRPENAEGFSRNEQAWRGVPPPCLADGQNFKSNGASACVRFGKTPSRVRSPQEICEARGLGGCSPVPTQTAVNAGVEQARILEAGKAKRQ